MIPDQDAWVELWHAMKDVTIVGHAQGSGHCPFTLGHSFREHIMYASFAGHWGLVDRRLQSIIDAGLHLAPCNAKDQPPDVVD